MTRHDPRGVVALRRGILDGCLLSDGGGPSQHRPTPVRWMQVEQGTQVCKGGREDEREGVFQFFVMHEQWLQQLCSAGPSDGNLIVGDP